MIMASLDGAGGCIDFHTPGEYSRPTPLKHPLILKLIRRKIRDERVVTLIARALKADRVMVDFDPIARRAYELRAASSEPGLEPGEEPKQLTEST